MKDGWGCGPRDGLPIWTDDAPDIWDGAQVSQFLPLPLSAFSLPRPLYLTCLGAEVRARSEASPPMPPQSRRYPDPRWGAAQGYGVTLGTINFLGVLAALFQAMPSLSFQARTWCQCHIGFRECSQVNVVVWPTLQRPGEAAAA